MDALYKFRVIINDNILFNDFIMQLNLIFRKITNFNDIYTGINKLITKFVIIKLNIKNEEEHRDEIIKYVYDKYITNGYVFHSINNVYKDQIIKNGFIPQEYNNLYPKFVKIKDIVKNDIISKDFSVNSVSFTDNFEMAYFYAEHSPLYFYELLCENKFIKKEEDKKAFIYNDYEGCMKNVNKLINVLELNDENSKYLKGVVDEEWKLINKTDSRPTVMAVKRSLVLKNKDVESININKILESRDLKLSEAIADIIDNRFEAVEFSDKLEAKDILFIELPNYKTFVKEEKVVKKEEYPKEEKKDIGNYNNDFGKASILILVGAILITLGVIITIIMTMVGG